MRLCGGCKNLIVIMIVGKILTGNVNLFNKNFEINGHSFGSGVVLLSLLNIC